MTDTPELIKPFYLDDNFMGVAKVERLGPCVRLTFFTPQRCGWQLARAEQVAVVRLVIPAEELPTIVRRIKEEPDGLEAPRLEAVSLN